VSNLPSITSDIPRDLRQFLERVREKVSGRDENALVSVRQLVASGLAEYNGRDLLPTTDTGSFQTPPAPTGLAASGALANIIVSWDTPLYNGHSYTEVWAAEPPEGGGNPQIGDAQLVGMAPGSVFAHNIGSGTTQYYWIKFVNVVGVAGPFNAVEGLEASTGQDPGYLLELLTGEIRDSQLAQSLGNRINLIDAPASVAGSVNNRINVVQSQVNDLISIPEWDSTLTYATNDQVIFDGGLFSALQPSTNVQPTDTDFWQRLGDFTTLGDAVAAQALQISQLDDGLTTAVTDTNLLATQMRGDHTGTNLSQLTSGLIFQERQARTGADNALTSSINSLQSTVNNNNTNLTAAIQSEAETRANADSALAQDISTVTAIAGSKARVFSQSTEPVPSENSPINFGDLWIDTNTTFAPDYMEGDYVIRSNRMYRWDGNAWEEAMDFGFADSFSAINTERTARVTGDTALAQEITSLTATVTNNNTNLTSAIQQEATTRSNQDTTLATNINTLQSTVNNNNTNLTSAIQQEATTRANADTTLSNNISTLQSTVTTNNTTLTAAIQSEAETRANADGSLFAQYTVKVETNGYVSGFGLASTAVNATPFSDFIVRADKFSIGSPTGPSISPATPFIVRTTPTTINGVSVPTGVYIADAFVQNGTITNAKIGDLAVDTAKIADGSIVRAKITDGEITRAKIDELAVDNARIANGAINRAKIQNGEITNAKIENGAITNAKIENGEITLAKINTASINSLSAITANMGTITAGLMQSTDGRFVIDLNNKIITITV